MRLDVNYVSGEPYTRLFVCVSDTHACVSVTLSHIVITVDVATSALASAHHGLILYAQRPRPSGAWEPYARQFVPFAERALYDDDDGHEVDLVNATANVSHPQRKCRVRLRIVDARAPTPEAAEAAMTTWRRYCDRIVATHQRINERVLAYFSNAAYDDVRARRDVCMLAANSFPIRNASIIGFLRPRFMRAPGGGEPAHDERLFERCLQVELDARTRTRDWFIDAARDATPTVRMLEALDIAMSALTVITRIMPYETDRDGTRDGDSYDSALVNLSGDCDDLGIAEFVLATTLTGNLYGHVHSAAVRAMQSLLRNNYTFCAAFGGVSSASAGDEDSQQQQQQQRGEYGNHFWCVAVRRDTAPTILPPAWMLEGTGYIAPSIIPLAMHAARIDRASRQPMLERQFYDTLYTHAVQQCLGDGQVAAAAIGPTYAYDLTANANAQMQAFFYREPVGLVDRDGICAICDLRGAYGSKILALLRSECTVRNIMHIERGSDEDAALDADADMRLPNPPLRVPAADVPPSGAAAAITLPTPLASIPPPTADQARCVCALRFNDAQAFIDRIGTLVASGTLRVDGLLAKHYPLLETDSGRVDLVQVVIARDVTPSMRATARDWSQFEAVHRLWGFGVDIGIDVDVGANGATTM